MLVFFSCFATLAVGQITLEQKDIIARNLDPMPGKAIVYVIRHSGYAFLVTMEIGCDSSHIGSVGAEEYVYTVLDPGNILLFQQQKINLNWRQCWRLTKFIISNCK